MEGEYSTVSDVHTQEAVVTEKEKQGSRPGTHVADCRRIVGEKKFGMI